MKKVLSVVGARPQFIKEAAVQRIMKDSGILEEVLVHTGQHFDHGMSQVFFEELEIKEPKYNLGISGGTHAEMTGRMMIELEKVIECEDPDIVLLYGDTNSTLAAALAAAKLHCPIAHVEAGGRTFCMTNPEEINRICTDHVSSILFASTEQAMSNLRDEGIAERATFVGNSMYDSFLYYGEKASVPVLRNLTDGTEMVCPEVFCYLTCHREENTATIETLVQILDALEQQDCATVYPVHPRNRCTVLDICKSGRYSRILFCEPVGYMESVYLTKSAQQVITDSGGLQTEAFFAETKCITVLPFVCWPETMVCNRNVTVEPKTESILRAFGLKQSIDRKYLPFGDGNAGQRIVEILERAVD